MPRERAAPRQSGSARKTRRAVAQKATAAPKASAKGSPSAPKATPPRAWWSAPNARLFRGDSLELLDELPESSFDLIFADPPYFLSNGGSTCKNGKRAKVDKGGWDRSRGPDDNHAFNRRWLEACQRRLTDDGSIFVSGTHHVIFSVGFAMQQLGFKILNEIVWQKPNPPPNLSCRYFTHSTEIVLWAAKHPRAKHHFDYPRMKALNGGKQMKNVWTFTAPPKREKSHGKHPTQKPLALLERILLAACPEGGRVLDPFNGSGTTGVCAASLGLDYTGIELDEAYLELSRARISEILAGDDALSTAV